MLTKKQLFHHILVYEGGFAFGVENPLYDNQLLKRIIRFFLLQHRRAREKLLVESQIQ